MPRYEYQCGGCDGVVVTARPMERRDDPATCPDCGGAATRVLSLPTIAQRAPRNADGSLDVRPAAGAPKRPTSLAQGHSHGPGSIPHSH